MSLLAGQVHYLSATTPGNWHAALVLPQANGVLETLLRKLALGVREIGAVAGNRTRTCALARRHSALKSQPRKLKGPEASLLPAHAISTKNKHLLVIYSIPARGFTAAVSVFRGTPPPKPLKCKSVSNRCGARLRSRWADPTGEEFVLLCAIFSFATADIIETSLG